MGPEGRTGAPGRLLAWPVSGRLPASGFTRFGRRPKTPKARKTAPGKVTTPGVVEADLRTPTGRRAHAWPLAAGRWPLAAGRWPLAAGRWPLAAGRWPLAAGRWPLAAGRWPLAAGRWPLAAGRWHIIRAHSRYRCQVPILMPARCAGIAHPWRRTVAAPVRGVAPKGRRESREEVRRVRTPESHGSPRYRVSSRRLFAKYPRFCAAADNVDWTSRIIYVFSELSVSFPCEK